MPFAPVIAKQATVKTPLVPLERDYKNVHKDVSALELAGLLVRDGRKLTAPWDEVQASVALAAPT